MEDWKLILGKIQGDIEYHSISHYRNAYKLEEFHYWQHIPGWMYKDSKSNKVNRVLDAGCAYGTLSCFAKKIYNCEVVAVDVQKYMDDAIQHNYDLDYRLLDIETEIDKVEGKFDRIIFTEVIEHLFYNPIDTLRNLKELLVDGGILYLSTPDAYEWGRVSDGYKNIGEMPHIGEVKKPDFELIDRHLYQYNALEIHDIIRDSGFRLGRFRYSKPGRRARHFNYELVKG
jgi:SAM-dependent methyltransferase